MIQSKEIKFVPIDNIKPWPENRNQHSPEQIDRLVKLIKYQGFRNPLVVSNQSGFLIAGHGRLEAARKLDLKEVPVIYQDFEDAEQAYAYMVSDNAIAAWAELDFSGINADIGDLGPDFDIDLLGIKNFTIDVADKEPGCDEDEVPSVPIEPKTKPGDIYELGDHRLMCGDSTNIQHVEDLMNGKKADLILTDHPYGVNYEGIKNDSRDGLKDLLSQCFDNYFIIMKSGCSIYVFHSDKCADIFHEEFRKRFYFSSMGIWLKPSLVMGGSDYQSKHEPCLYGWKEGAKHEWFSDRKQTSVWEFGREPVDGHTTPKPVELLKYLVENSSSENEHVADLFGGSGSTLIACEKTNRKCFMMELDPYYCDVIVSRFEKFTGKTAKLIGGSNG